MNKLFVEIEIAGSLDNPQTKIFTTVNSFLTLYVHKYLGAPKNIHLNYIQSDGNTKEAKLELQRDALEQLVPENVHTNNEQQDLKLPVYVKDRTTFISGLCAVSRELVQRNDVADRRDLLGFKESCLLAPSESSIWTRFCELDVISDLNRVVLREELERIPEVLSRFEGHMNEPVRMHNIYKLARQQANASSDKGRKNQVRIECTTPKETLAIEHRFAEGISFTIADLILYPCFELMRRSLPVQFSFAEAFPLAHAWIGEINAFDPLCQATSEALLALSSPENQEFVLNFQVSECQKTSLYKSDPKRYKPRNRIYTSQSEVDSSLEKLSKLDIAFTSDSDVTYETLLDWEAIEPGHSEKSALPQERLERKKRQLENLANAVISLANDGDRIVDFCSGTGHLGILLALKLPKCTIIILENKAISIERAKKRAGELGISNCLFYQCNLDYFNGKFDIGTSLHACGTATDIVLQKCMQSRAKFVTCPCCYGSIQPMPHIAYPLSAKFRSILGEKDYLHIAHAADQAHELGTMNCKPEMTAQGCKCMDIVDSDRKLQAEEAGYTVILTRLQPENCTPKNRLLVGVC